MLARPLGRLGIITTLACTALAIGASGASASSATASLSGCATVTFTYKDTGAGQTVKATETVTANGKTVATKQITFTQSSSGATTTDTVPVSGVSNGETAAATVTYSITPDGQSGTITIPLGTITTCPVTYTGDAYNVGLTGLLPLGPINEEFANPTGGTNTNTVASETINSTSPTLNVTGSQATSTVATGGDVSKASTSVNNLSVAGGLLGPVLPAINIDATSSSTTTCNTSTSTDSYSGSTVITSLTIGGTKVTIPSPLNPNTSVISIPGVASLILNQQIPVMYNGKQDGLTVNAVNVSLLAGTVDVIVGQSSSDIEGC